MVLLSKLSFISESCMPGTTSQAKKACMVQSWLFICLVSSLY